MKSAITIPSMCYAATSQIRTSMMWASPSTGQPSRDILLKKCLELDVVIGMVIACCSVFYTFSLTDISHLWAPYDPKVPG